MATITKEKAFEIWEQTFGNVPQAKDVAGAWMMKDQYGNTTKLGFGWEIDHKVPESKGGSDSNFNLRPLHWENNRSKLDNYPSWTSVVTSQGDRNIYWEKHWTFNK